ncbi:RsmB/NOP family class I SAM-dependent RNA methyltransferase [Deinococcus sonorensis]|uniref:Transcription antitermination factor NusB n=1 Tax=Deinococcus sonorensis KR-87 TaxID=694439 RepID=A0AAU7UAZ4_9DEIO
MTVPTPKKANPARSLAMRVLGTVLESASFAAPTLDDALQQARLSARDAGLATHLVYGTLRHLPVLDAALAPLLRGPTPLHTRVLLLCGSFEKLVLGTPPHAVVNEYVTLARQGKQPPGLINAVLRRVELLGPLDPQSTLPAWLADEYRAAYGDAAPAIFQSLLEPQPLWLRLRPAGVEALEEEGGTLEPGANDMYRVQLGRPLRDSAAFRQGWAQPINPASLACVQALGDVSGQPVLDLAGGAGVKAAMLAAAGANVTSVDVVEGKHRAARRNLERLGLQARFVTANLTATPDLSPAPAVLLDAPCTGSGTLRAHPEIKLRLTPASVQELADLQGQLLDTAAQLTLPGGVLVYSVCSVTHAEGPDMVEGFLSRHPEFQPEPLPDLDVPAVPSGQGVLTVPLDGIDGFFIARMRRQD